MTTQAEFIEWFAGLAPEDETALLTWQKPLLENGSPQYHADGAPKAVWPAFTPEKKFKPDQAIYGNTGSFILSKFPDGKPSASREYCDHVLVMVLDDIGTDKAKELPLPPTWIMETSSGCYQWGYAFGLDDQPTRGVFAEAIRSIADAGFTDRGAINAVRNFRLPGSINLKRGRGGFAARLVEFRPEREYSLAEICNAAGISVPQDGSGMGEFRPIHLTDDGGDTVLAWLSSQGLVLSRANGEGWQGVVCPNSAAHSDGNPEARYNAAARAFCCMHGHCQHIDTRTFLAWVEENGGPKEAPGVRPELLSQHMKSAINKLPAGPVADGEKDKAAAFIEQVNARERDRVEQADWFARYAYIESDDGYFDLERRDMVSRTTFDALYRHVLCRSVHGATRIKASLWFDENRQAMGGKALRGLTYAAGDDAVVARDASGTLYGNRWRNARPSLDGAGGDVTPWLTHCRKLVPDADELAHVLNVMAFKLQQPRVKINHAILHMGDEGCGKDSMWAPFIWAVCGDHLLNRAVVNGDDIGGQWGYPYESEILILNELREPAAMQRRQLANRLKPVIAAPPDTLSINRKMLHPYEAANRLFVLAFSNESVPLTLSTQDRRWFVVRTTSPIMPIADAERLWAWYKEGGGYKAVAAWLQARDVSQFNPHAAPPMTADKADIVESSMSSNEAWLTDMVRDRRGMFAGGVVGSPINKLLRDLSMQAPGGKDLYPDTLHTAMRHAKWIRMDRVHSREHPTDKTLWVHPDLASEANSKLRAMVEAPAGVLKFTT